MTVRQAVAIARSFGLLRSRGQPGAGIRCCFSSLVRREERKDSSLTKMVGSSESVMLCCFP
jgi:hypothetical protein